MQTKEKIGEMDKNIIIGLGTGRCGSVSLTTLLNLQKDFNITHEVSPAQWEFSNHILNHLLNILNNRKELIVGDVAYYHLNYSEKILELLPNTKFPIMIRDKEETINSYMKKTLGRNHWSYNLSKGEKSDAYWDRTYPVYNLPKREAIAQYYDDYYNECQKLINKYPNNFKLFEMKHALTSLSGQNELLSFLKIKPGDRIINLGIKKNES